MTPQIKKWIQENISPLSFDKVLEVGSRDVNGIIKEDLNTREYIGIDIQYGPNVNKVMRSYEIPDEFAKHEFDCVICLEMLEHDPFFWLSIENMRHVLRPDGYLVISTPANGFPEHRHPVDCYRFMPDTYRFIFFKDMDIIKIDNIVDTANNPGIIGYAKKKS